MALIGKLVEELMGDKFNSKYGMKEYSGRTFTVGAGNDKVRGNMNECIGFCFKFLKNITWPY